MHENFSLYSHLQWRFCAYQGSGKIHKRWIQRCDLLLNSRAPTAEIRRRIEHIRKKCATCTLSLHCIPSITETVDEHCPHKKDWGGVLWWAENEWFASDRRCIRSEAICPHGIWRAASCRLVFIRYGPLSFPPYRGNGIKRAEHKLHRGKYRQITVQADHIPAGSLQTADKPFFQHEKWGLLSSRFILPLNNGYLLHCIISNPL